MTSPDATAGLDVLAAVPFGACLLVRDGEREFWRVSDMNDRFASLGRPKEHNWRGMPVTGLLRGVLDEDRMLQVMDCLARNRPFEVSLRGDIERASALRGRPNPSSPSSYLIMLRGRSGNRTLRRVARELATLRSDGESISGGALLLIASGGRVLSLDGGPHRVGLVDRLPDGDDSNYIENVLIPPLVGPAYRTLLEARNRKGAAFTSIASDDPGTGRITLTSAFLGDRMWLMLVAPPRQAARMDEARPLVAGLVSLLARRLETTAVFFDTDLRIQRIFEPHHLADAAGRHPHEFQSLKDLVDPSQTPRPGAPGGLPSMLAARWDERRRWSLLPLQPFVGFFLGLLEPQTTPSVMSDDALALLESSKVAVVSLDSELRVRLATRAAAHLWGLEPQDLEGRTLSALLEPKERSLGLDPASISLAADMHDLAFDAVCLAGDDPGLSVHARLIRAETNDTNAHVLLLNERSGTGIEQTRLHRLAFNDPVTRLPNRILFADNLAQLIERADRDGRRFAIMAVDIDRFRVFNESLGMALGDRLLHGFGERILELASDRLHAARLSADRFLIVLDSDNDAEELEARALRLLASLGSPLEIDGQSFNLSVCAGLALFPDEGRDADTLIRYADIALGHAKRAGRGHLRRFTATMNEHAAARLMLETNLRNALEQRQLAVHFQPQIAIDDGSIIGFEALLRWHHPELGTISPGDFIPVAEETGMIVEIGRWALARAMREVRRWHAAGFDRLRLAVNLSARQFEHADLPGQIREAAQESDFPPGLLELELTESMVMHSGNGIVERLRALEASGVTLAVDDFGTGYSSLAYLKRFPIRSLKIDRSFIADIDHDSNSAAIVEAIVAMGRALGLKTIAEGVESPGQLEALRRFRCDEVQGFLFARPMPASDIPEFLAQLNNGRIPSFRGGAASVTHFPTPPDRSG
ncbi:MAG: EAL domain-containing protein [Geminicoccaceae bacterium]|nr:EAL domain-containing protein [Geminicoccaceae bacterium]